MLADFFNTNYLELNSKIINLSYKIEQMQSTIFYKPSNDQWESVFNLCKEINNDFKNTHYPSKNEREIAWNKFFDLRDSAYKIRNNQLNNCSSNHYNDIMSQLNSTDYNSLGDFIIGEVASFGLLKTNVEEMKAKGLELNRICVFFKSIKHEMTFEHKKLVHERIITIRKNHDIFWEKYKSYNSSKQRISQNNYLQEKNEKSRLAKSKIENNIEKNIQKLNKAKMALERMRTSKYELQSKIDSSYNYNWKLNAENWLYELKNKISDVENQIEEIQTWIDEDRYKLQNWN